MDHFSRPQRPQHVALTLIIRHNDKIQQSNITIWLFLFTLPMRTCFSLDPSSPNCGYQLFEDRVSALYFFQSNYQPIDLIRNEYV